MKEIVLMFSLLTFLGVHAFGARLTTVTEKATGPGVRIVDAEVKLATGEFNLYKEALAKDEVAKLTGDYDESVYEYDYSFDPSGKRGDLFFSSEIRSRIHTNIDGHNNRWDIAFSPDVELRLNADIGAAKADLNFGDLALSELKLNVGAAEARVDFPTANKTPLNYFKVSAGACELKIYGIGNSRCDEFEFEGGVGSFLLDFSGQYEGRMDTKIDIGLGSVDITIPADLGVRLEADDNFLSSVNFPKDAFKRVHEGSDIYETENYDTAKGQITLRLHVGLGSANIKIR